MLKQRKHSQLDDQSSPNGNYYLSKDNFFLINRYIYYCTDAKEENDIDDVADDDNNDDECSTDRSDDSQKTFVFAD